MKVNHKTGKDSVQYKLDQNICKEKQECWDILNLVGLLNLTLIFCKFWFILDYRLQDCIQYIELLVGV